MALFRSRFASVLRHRYSSASGLFSLTTPELKTSRVTSVLSHQYHQYRSSSASRFLSTMMKTPTSKDASNHLNRTVEERNEKHRKVQQLAKDVNLLILSCESIAEGGVCDVYVVGFSSFYSLEAVKAAQAIMSYLKPQVLFLPFGYKPMLSKLRKYSPTNLIKAFANKPVDDFRILGFLSKLWPTVESKLCPTVERVAYREAIKYGSNVVLGDRPEEISKDRWELMPTCIQLDDIYLLSAIMTYEQEKLAWLIFHQLFEVARKNSSVVAIVPCPSNASRSFDNLGRINEYWKQLVEV